MDKILDLFLKQIFGQPFMLMGIVVFIGYCSMGEKISKSLMGAVKASIGVLVLGIGSGGLITNFNKVIDVIREGRGLKGAGLNTYPTMVEGFEKMDKVLGAGIGASWGIYTLLLAFILNIILVYYNKYTKIKSVFLTGNVMLVQAGISTYLVWRYFNLSAIPTIIIASVVTAIYWGIFSTLLIKPTNEITNSNFTVGHQQMFMCWIAYKTGKFFGNPEKDNIENKKLPPLLNIFQDNVIATAFIMLVSLGILFVVMGKENIALLKSKEYLNQMGLKNNFIFLIWESFILTSYIYVLLAGVRMFVGELMASFKGISDKILPGAVPAVDCAATFAFSPKAVILGLVFGTIGQVIGLLLLIIFKFPIFIIPGFIPLFFDNATVSIFANKYGGWKASMVLVVLCGIVQILGSGLALSLLDMKWWQGSADYSTVWVAIIYIFKYMGNLLGIPIAG